MTTGRIDASLDDPFGTQWLKYWLVDNPVDEAGVTFYVPMGRHWKFERQDVDRILAHMRKLESARLGQSGKSKARPPTVCFGRLHCAACHASHPRSPSLPLLGIYRSPPRPRS